MALTVPVPGHCLLCTDPNDSNGKVHAIAHKWIKYSLKSVYINRLQQYLLQL